jgi:hypothetical protein
MKVPAKLWSEIGDVKSQLEELTADLRDAWGEHSEKWQESDKGDAADTWIEELENLRDEMENITDRPED